MIKIWKLLTLHNFIYFNLTTLKYAKFINKIANKNITIFYLNQKWIFRGYYKSKKIIVILYKNISLKFYVDSN